MRFRPLLPATLLVACQSAPPEEAPAGTAAVAPAAAEAAPPTHPELAEELIVMEAADQVVRAELMELLREHPDESPSIGLALRLTLIDRKHTARMQEIVAEHGWPTIAMVGEAGAGAAWILVQHADHAPDFQADVLERIRPLMATGEVERSDVALLTDRVLTGRGLPQRYGTQYTTREIDGVVRFGPTTPIEDPEGLDARRAEMGLVPHSEYVALVREHLGVPDDAPPLPSE